MEFLGLGLDRTLRQVYIIYYTLGLEEEEKNVVLTKWTLLWTRSLTEDEKARGAHAWLKSFTRGLFEPRGLHRPKNLKWHFPRTLSYSQGAESWGTSHSQIDTCTKCHLAGRKKLQHRNHEWGRYDDNHGLGLWEKLK